MAKRGRPPTKAEKLKPVSAQATPPDPQTKRVSDAHLNDTPSDQTFQGACYPSQRNTKNTATLCRRSTRFKSSSEPVKDMQPAAVELDPVETVNRVEPPSNMENHPPEETDNAREEHSDKEKSPEVAGMNYRKMYIVSHKKVKTLTKQNRVLRRQLERALAKIEAYAELTPTLSSLSKANQILSTRSWTGTKGLKS